MSRINVKSPTILAALAVAVLAVAGPTGCASGKKKETPKQAATQKWNRARAGVTLSLARDQYKTGNFAQCRKSVDDGLKLDPDNTELHVLSAKLAIEEGQLELAERELAAARTLAPGLAEPYYLSGVVYQRWQKAQTAFDFYKAASERAPAELAYLMAQSEMLVSMDRAPEALAMLKDKVAYFEHSGAIRDAVGQLLMRTGRYREAAESFRHASILSSQEDSIRERLGLALYFDHQYRAAAETLAPLTANEPYSKRADLMLALGESQMQSDRPRDARLSFDRAVELDPGSTAAYLGLAKAALQCNDLKRTDLALRKAQSLDPLDGETHLLIGYLRLRQNRMKDALSAFQKASALDRADTVSVCMIGYVFQKSGRTDLAMQYYGRALKLKPADELASKLMAGVDLND